MRRAGLVLLMLVVASGSASDQDDNEWILELRDRVARLERELTTASEVAAEMLGQIRTLEATGQAHG